MQTQFHTLEGGSVERKHALQDKQIGFAPFHRQTLRGLATPALCSVAPSSLLQFTLPPENQAASFGLPPQPVKVHLNICNS